MFEKVHKSTQKDHNKMPIRFSKSAQTGSTSEVNKSHQKVTNATQAQLSGVFGLVRKTVRRDTATGGGALRTEDVSMQT